MRVFLFVVLLCFHTAYAQTDVHRLLLDGNAPQLRQAAKLMVSGQQNNSENAELLAEILWRKYPTATSRDIDALSWACKALAASKSGRYRSLLKEVYQSQAHKKLRKYAKQSFNRLPAEQVEQFQGGQYKFKGNEKPEPYSKKPEIASKANDESYFLIPKPTLLAQERMLFSIAKGDLLAIKAIARQFYSQFKSQKHLSQKVYQKNTRQLLDALSQFLTENYLNTFDKQKIDTLVWICQAIGRSNDSRYTQLMKRVSENATAEKVQGYALSAYQLLPPAERAFEIERFDFIAIVADFKMQRI